ncbi:MAG: VWA domain-containing protein [Firmicutes bacterium]|jgi:uncharacterized protein with von Willebrand factor type A (vWA) domain|nr:VWA domain-containing protein [Bacillota bacterium]
MVKNSFEIHIVNFASLLRRQGVLIGTAELLDALEAIMITGLDDRRKFKAALRATMVKKAADFDLFERNFEHYFASPGEAAEQWHQGKKLEKRYQRYLDQADEELVFMGEQLDLEESEKVVFSALPEKERARIRHFVRETEEGNKISPTFKPMLESIVKGSLRYWRSRHGLSMQRPPAVTGDSCRDWALAASGEGSSTGLKMQDMSMISGKDVAAATEIMRKMSRKLAVSLSRRYKMGGQRWRFDPRRTMRNNMSHGGYIYELKYVQRKKHKLRLLLLCDVSGSMIRYTGFILPFIYGLNAVVGDIESFVFAEGLERITPFLARGLSFEETIREVMKDNKQWGGGTRLGVALDGILCRYESLLTPRTIVLIISDTKTTSLQHALENVNALKAKVKDVIWLNTLPKPEWERFRSVQSFGRVTRMFPCNRLIDLERIVEKKII